MRICNIEESIRCGSVWQQRSIYDVTKVRMNVGISELLSFCMGSDQNMNIYKFWLIDYIGEAQNNFFSIFSTFYSGNTFFLQMVFLVCTW